MPSATTMVVLQALALLLISGCIEGAKLTNSTAAGAGEPHFFAAGEETWQKTWSNGGTQQTTSLGGDVKNQVLIFQKVPDADWNPSPGSYFAVWHDQVGLDPKLLWKDVIVENKLVLKNLARTGDEFGSDGSKKFVPLIGSGLFRRPTEVSLNEAGEVIEGCSETTTTCVHPGGPGTGEYWVMQFGYHFHKGQDVEGLGATNIGNKDSMYVGNGYYWKASADRLGSGRNPMLVSVTVVESGLVQLAEVGQRTAMIGASGSIDYYPGPAAASAAEP